MESTLDSASSVENHSRNTSTPSPRNGELTFQNLRYIITVFTTPSEVLHIEAEQKTDGARWHGSFSARNIEDMTQRTGSYKKFPVFRKMLYSAILQNSDSVFVDLLTYHDLEYLKCRKGRKDDRIKKAPVNNKRYLILTYIGEFDRIHYPLPLAHEDNLEPEILRRTIKRLRMEVQSLKKQLNITNDSNGSSHSHSISDEDEQQKLRKENTRLLAQIQSLEESMIQQQGYKDNNTTTIDEDKKKLSKDLALYQKKYNALLAKSVSQKDVQVMKDKITELQGTLTTEREKRNKWVASLTREKQALSEQVRVARESEKTMRHRFRETERELELLKRRLKLQGPRNSESPRIQSRASSQRGTPRSTQPSSREISPAHSRQSNSGFRASSCPTVGSNHNLKINTSEIPRLPIYQDYLTRKATSLSGSRQSPCRGSPKFTRSVKSGESDSRSSPRYASPLRRNSLEMPVSPKKMLCPVPPRSAPSGSPGENWRSSTEKKERGRAAISNSTGSESICTGEEEYQGAYDGCSGNDSPRRVLQQVKAKLAEYARIQEESEMSERI